MVVLAVTPNPALDVTYVVDVLQPGGTHRVRSVTTRPGGKGVNVARVLAALGIPVTATGLVGGVEGAELRQRLARSGVADAFVEAGLRTRRTVAVVEDAGRATLLNEPGPEVASGPWEALLDRVRSLIHDVDVMVCSGSLPPGISPDSLGDLVRVGAASGVPVVVDTSGPALSAAIRAGAAVVKPNAAELTEATGSTDPWAGADSLRAGSDCAVVASLGPDGLLAVTGAGSWQARPSGAVDGNPTGAGDSVVAALAAGLRKGSSWPDIVRDATALSAATVVAPVAGEFDPGAYERFGRSVGVEQVAR